MNEKQSKTGPGSCRALAVAVTALLAGGLEAQDRRVIILGIDGMDHRLLTQFIDEGVLPNFARLAADSTWWNASDS